MKRQTYILLLLLIFSLQFSIFNCNAQTYFNVDFNNDSSQSSLGNFIHPFADGSGYLAIGSVPMSGNIVYTRFLRLNTLGDTLWTKLYRNNPLAQFPSNGNYVNIGDTNFVFTGIFSPQTSDSMQTILFKIDSAGNVLWDFKFGDAGMKTPPFDIKATTDGGYIITGWTTGWGSTNTASSFLLKVDSNGVEEWHKIYGGGSFREAFSVEVTADNGYIMAGDFYQSTATKEDINVVKTDSLGNLIWNKTYGTPEKDGTGYITEYGTTGDYILVSAIDILPSFLADIQGYIARIDGVNGNVIWADTMGVAQNGVIDVFTSNVIILPDGNIIGIGGTHYTSSTGALDAWIVKYDGNGNLLWQRNFNKYGGNNQNYFWDVHQTSDGGFVLCGDLLNLAVPEKNLWVLKLDSNGCEIANCSVGVEEESPPSGDLGGLVFPNPSNGIFTLELTAIKNASIEVYNIAGQLILQKEVAQNDTKIDLTKQPKGLYLLKIISNNNVVTKRIIKY